MSVRTTCDELIDEAKDHIKEANRKLKKALDQDTWGYDEYKKEYILDLHEIQEQLARIIITKLD